MAQLIPAEMVDPQDCKQEGGGGKPLNLGEDFHAAKPDSGHLANGGPLRCIFAHVLTLCNRECGGGWILVCGCSILWVTQPGTVYYNHPSPPSPYSYYGPVAVLSIL